MDREVFKRIFLENFTILLIFVDIAVERSEKIDEKTYFSFS